jgi:methyl-accepting chemotaxis protein
MRKKYLLAALVSSSLLTACGGPQSPQEVSRAFWLAVVEQDAGEANEYSTLIEDAGFDGYQRDWQGVEVEWGRVVIDGNQATVDATFRGLSDRQNPLETTTYLVQKDDQWLVDYYRTGEALNDGPLWGDVVNQLEALGKDLQSQLTRHSNDLAREFEALREELSQQASEAGESFSGMVDDYGQMLRQHIEQLSDSLREALKNNPEASVEDRQLLNEAVIRLEEQSDELEQPDVQSVTESTRVALATQLQLGDLGEEFSGYKAQWQQRLADMEKELAEFVDQLNRQS